MQDQRAAVNLIYDKKKSNNELHRKVSVVVVIFVVVIAVNFAYAEKKSHNELVIC